MRWALGTLLLLAPMVLPRPGYTAEPADDKALIAGTVLDAAGKPVAGVSVWLVGGIYDDKPQALAKETTDAQGRFAFRGLVQEKLLGRNLRLPSLLARDVQGRPGWMRGLRDHELPARDLKIKLHDVADHRGRVLVADGTPLAGARIEPLFFLDASFRERNADYTEPFLEWMKEYAAQTAADGTFVLPRLPVHGSVHATVTAPGYGTPRLSWDLGSAVVLRLARAGSVHGKLTGAPDKVAAGIKLHLRRQSGNPSAESAFQLNYRSDGTAGAGGAFHFDDVPPGTYLLTPEIDSLTPFYTEPTLPLQVTAGIATANLLIALRPTVHIGGRVIDKTGGAGLPGVEIYLYYVLDHQHLLWTARTTTDAAGRYEANVKPQRLTVRVQQAPAGHLLPPEGSSPQIDAAKERELPPLALPRAASLRGVVVDKEGKPVAGAHVRVILPPRGAHDQPAPVVSDAAGNFTLTGLDPTDTVPLRARTERATTDGAVVVVPADVKEPVRLVVAEENAFRLRGTVVDAAGRPVADVPVRVEWNFTFVSKRTQLSGSSAYLQKLRTGAEGRFETAALWPADTYRVEVAADGYARTESIRVKGQAGQVHDLGGISLLRTGGVVHGRVLDTAGDPIAGVRVFNSGDAPKPVATRTDAQGRFRLGDLFAGPVYVFAEKAGYRFTVRRVAADGPEIALKLLKADEAPPGTEARDTGPSFAEQQRIARKMLERVWALPPERRSSGLRSLLESMARLDPAQALQWADKAGGRYVNTVRTTAAQGLALTDPDEALALLAQVDGESAYYALQEMTERCLEKDPARALRYAEEAIVRARTREQPARTWSLAEMGTLVRRLGKEEAGRKLIDEAATQAAKLGTEAHQALARGMVAEALAPYDEPRGKALIEPITGAVDRIRYVTNFLAARGIADPGLPSRSALRVAYQLAPSKPTEAIRVVDALREDPKIKAEAYGWLAVAVAPKDKQLAWSLIDRSLAVYLDHADALRSWSNYGGASVFAARVAGQARQVGYPDLDSVVARVLALRVPPQYDSPARVTEAHAVTAMVLALAYPATARQILETLEPRSQVIGTGFSSVRRGHWLLAWTLADPVRAAEMFERELKALEAKPKANLGESELLEMAALLTIAPPDRPRHLLRHFGAFWFPGQE